VNENQRSLFQTVVPKKLHSGMLVFEIAPVVSKLVSPSPMSSAPEHSSFSGPVQVSPVSMIESR